MYNYLVTLLFITYFSHLFCTIVPPIVLIIQLTLDVKRMNLQVHFYEHMLLTVQYQFQLVNDTYEML